MIPSPSASIPLCPGQGRSTRRFSERQLTSDAFADLQPAWSPDGRRLAFVTDRFSSHLENLSAGEYQLAVFDVASAQIRPVRTFDEGKSINPQWNADGRRVYFVSDRDGISNVYVVNVDSGALGQVTNVDAGVSGITALPRVSRKVTSNSKCDPQPRQSSVTTEKTPRRYGRAAPPAA